ncbi:MAG: alkene reductase, partial [Ramlibacter sp.]
YGTDQLDGWKGVTHAVHEQGGRIVVQLWHVGRVSHNELQPGGGQPVAPSAITAKTKTVLFKDGVPTFVETSEPRALRADELPGIVHAFAAAARNAVETSGFDGVELHGANGYLLDQFLKTGSNKRTDDYGGGIENRARLLLEATRAVADAVGGGKTGIRLSPVTPANDAYDENPQPLFDYVVRQLASLNLAYIHIIEGATGGPREIADRPFDYEALKRAYREAGGNGAWMVNNGYDKALAEQAVAHGADLVAFGKPYLANPDLVERLRRGAPLNAPDKATFYGGGARGYTDYPALA